MPHDPRWGAGWGATSHETEICFLSQGGERHFNASECKVEQPGYFRPPWKRGRIWGRRGLEMGQGPGGLRVQFGAAPSRAVQTSLMRFQSRTCRNPPCAVVNRIFAPGYRACPGLPRTWSRQALALSPPAVSGRRGDRTARNTQPMQQERRIGGEKRNQTFIKPVPRSWGCCSRGGNESGHFPCPCNASQEAGNPEPGGETSASVSGLEVSSACERQALPAAAEPSRAGQGRGSSASSPAHAQRPAGRQSSGLASPIHGWIISAV